MCIQTAIQDKIAELTNDGEDIATFLADILRGADPSVKTCHRLEAAKLLTKYGAQPDNITKFPSPVKGEGQDGGENTVHPERVEGQERMLKPTLRDIVAFPLARYIRERTDGGETIIYALRHIMEGGHYDPDPFTGYPRPTVKPREKIAAAKELMRRAMGEYAPPRRASVAYEPDAELDAEDPVNSAIAKLVREHTDNGIEAAEVLIQVIESDPRDGEWQSSHRLTAARELFHRAYDLNYDAVTWKDYEDYHRASEEYNEAYEIGRARRKAEISAILAEYHEAYAARDEEAMAAIEEKYYAYHRAQKGEEEEVEYAEYGPADPDPTPQQPIRAPEPKRTRRNKRRPAAADIHPPKLTIPLKNKFLPP